MKYDIIYADPPQSTPDDWDEQNHRKEWEYRVEQFKLFYATRHASARKINTEFTQIKSDIREIKYHKNEYESKRSVKTLKKHDQYDRLVALENRFVELKATKDAKKELLKQFAPKYYIRPDFIWDGDKYTSTGEGLFKKVRFKDEARRLTGLPFDNDFDPPGTPEVMFKICTCCEEEKSVDDYYKHPTTKDGVSSQCKLCNREASDAARARKHARKKKEGKNGK